MLQRVQSAGLDCYHCGLPVTNGSDFFSSYAGETRHFCCPACQSVAEIIIGNGLSSFYSHQEFSKVAVESRAELDNFAVFDDLDYQQQFVTERDSSHSRCSLLIEGMHCIACVWLLEKYLTDIPGIERVHVSFTEQKAEINWNHDSILLSKIAQAISRLGYKPEPYSTDLLAKLRVRENHQALRRLGVAGIAMMQVGMFAIALYAGALQGIAQEYRDFIRWVSFVVATPVVFYCAKPFFIGAWRGLLYKKAGMDLPVALAIGMAYLASIRATFSGEGDVYFDSVTMFTFLLLGGRYLEMRARHYSDQRSNDLNSLLPGTVTRLSSLSDKTDSNAQSQRQVIPLSKIRVKDLLLVKPGQIVPADGIIVEGDSHINEAQLTGEFMPVTKHKGDEVVAGSINGDGLFTIRVESTGMNTKLHAISDLLSQAQTKKPKIALIADQYAGYFVSAVLFISVATYFYWSVVDNGSHSDDAFWIMLSVLVVSCPCALSLATPTALTIAGNRLHSLGILITDSQVWEKISSITDVVFDKTGTLTKGELSLAQVIVIGGISENKCNAIAVALEAFSSHPIAGVFSKFSDRNTFATGVKVNSGFGIEGTIDGEVYRIGRCDYASSLYGVSNVQSPDNGQWILLSGSHGPLCWYKLQDELRDDAPLLIAHLKARGLITHILSGDSSGDVSDLAKKLEFDHCVSGADPGSKLKYIECLQKSGAKVLMLGDGINDIPVLAAADISVAMSNASNLAKTHADSILLSSRLTAINTLIELAARTRQIVLQNISWALGYNIVAIPLAAMALIPPYLAALGMSLSSLIVIFNALRLRQFKRAENLDSIYSTSTVGV